MRQAAKVTLIVFVLQLAVLLGTSWLMTTHGGSIAHEISTQDAREYMLLGEVLLEEGKFHLPDRTEAETWRTPGYPAFVATIFALFHSLYVLLVVLALLGALTSGVIYLIAKELLLSERNSFAAGLIFGLSPAVIWIPPSGMGGDILFAFLLVVALYCLVLLARGRDLGFSLIHMGLFLGAATLVRPIGLYIAVIFIFATFFFIPKETRSLKMPFLVLLMFALLTVPWMWRNYYVAGHFSLTSQFAFNPFFYNIPLFTAWKNGTGEEAERVKLMDSVGTRDVYALVNGYTYYDKLKAIDTAFLKENFVPYAVFHAYKMIPFFAGSGVNVIYATITNEIPNLEDIPYLPRATENTSSLFYGGDLNAVASNLVRYWPSTVERIVWALAFLLAFLAPLFARGLQRKFALLSILMILVIAGLSSPIAQPRYRIPAEPFIWLGAAICLASLRLRLLSFANHKKQVVPQIKGNSNATEPGSAKVHSETT